MTTKHIPIIDNAPPTADDMNELIAYLESAEGTAYVHCEAGVGRTGVMVACCRMAQAGRWPTPCTRQNSLAMRCRVAGAHRRLGRKTCNRNLAIGYPAQRPSTASNRRHEQGSCWARPRIGLAPTNLPVPGTSGPIRRWPARSNRHARMLARHRHGAMLPHPEPSATATRPDLGRRVRRPTGLYCP